MLFKVPVILLKAFCTPLLKLLFSFQIEGRKQWRDIPGPVILAGNHAGILDGPMVLSSFECPFAFLLSEVVFTWGLIGKLMPFANIIPIQVGMPRQGLKAALRQLSRGHSLCIFPEGKLTCDGELNALNAGVALLQEKSQVPIIPFAIRGGFEAWPIDQFLPRLMPVSICYGEPIYPGQTIG
jgi:1-acyl-sn-glycerol-3-phosphate acyltransferase